MSQAILVGRTYSVSFREVVESLNIAVFVVDTNSKILEANDAGRQLLREETIVGQSVEDALETCRAMEKYRDRTTTHGSTGRHRVARPVIRCPLTPLNDSRDTRSGACFLSTKSPNKSSGSENSNAGTSSSTSSPPSSHTTFGTH